ncbi:hypothetical protein F8388_005666 [Cannabis sativa]|uniref:Reverse transcriptase zinc-binding domain-containing protein n=1 Tax=Cannabis sativa TaxID=3483 RepID=A0A7J6ENU8_CANSA|nr:hypothetical protein F8388_005666 [Cannabis sativa]
MALSLSLSEAFLSPFTTLLRLISLLNLKPWPVEGEARMADFEVARFWVEFHGLPTRCLSEANVPILAKKGVSQANGMGDPDFWAGGPDVEGPRGNCFTAGSIQRDILVNDEGLAFQGLKKKGTWKRHLQTRDQKNLLTEEEQRPEKITHGDRAPAMEGTMHGTATTMQKSGNTRKEKLGTDVRKDRCTIRKAVDPSTTKVNLNIPLSMCKELPSPDFAYPIGLPTSESLIPDIGPTLTQSLKIPHIWTCKSQQHHHFHEPIHLRGPSNDPELQKIYSQLLGLESIDLYKAQPSLISNPPSVSELINHLLGTKKRKVHTWYHPSPDTFENSPFGVHNGESGLLEETNGGSCSSWNPGVARKFEPGTVLHDECATRKIKKDRARRSMAKKQSFGVKTLDGGFMTMFCNRLGFPNVVCIPTSGLAGGFCVAWRRGVDIRLHESLDSSFGLAVNPRFGLETWYLYCVYGTSYPREKAGFWEMLTRAIQRCGKLSSNLIIQEEFDSLFEKKVLDQENTDLCRIPTPLEIKDAGDIDIWTVPWVPGFSPQEIQQSFSYNVTHSFTFVSDLFQPGSRTWDEDLIKQCFAPDIAAAILSIRPLEDDVDMLFWKHGADGKYSVKKTYWLSQHFRFHEEKPAWKRLWTLKLHPRQLVFLWRILSECLPLKSRLGFTRMDDKQCVFCGDAIETELHLFCHCPFARMIWFLSPWGIGVVMYRSGGGEAHKIQSFYCVTSVLEAELLAILTALEQATKEKFHSITIHSDSKIAVDAMRVGELPLAWGSYPKAFTILL